MVLVYHRVSLATRDEPAINREGRYKGDRQGERQASPEKGTTIIRLSKISMIVIDSVSEANARGSAVASVNPDRSSGSIVSE
jgi:hypothetical protein